MSVSYGGDSITFADSSTITSGWTGFKNRLINGGMVIDQRNAGASVTQTATNIYSLDRWQSYGSQASKMTVQQSSSAPTGFVKSLLVTSSSAYSVLSSDIFLLRQHIEGSNILDFGWGTSSAVTATLSFWVRSSLTGTFGGVFFNTGGTLVYPFNYTINSADTWEQKTITVAGPTTGGATLTNASAMQVIFGLGVGSTYSASVNSWSSSGAYSSTGATSLVGTSGATFYITGVQFEKGSAASSFEYRPFSTELQLCQRYYEKSFDLATKPQQNLGSNAGALSTGAWSTSAYAVVATAYYAVRKRATPTTVTYYNPYASGAGWSRSGSGNYTASSYGLGESCLGIRCDSSIGSVDANMSIHWTSDAEF